MVKPSIFKGLNLAKSATAIAVMLSLVACDESTSSTQGSQFGQAESTPTTPTDSFNQSLLLESLNDNVILPTYTRFSEKALSQESVISEYCSGLSSQAADSDALKVAAQQSWREAMAVWQMAEVMQIGPLLENSNSLRNRIYSWPNTSACAVDQDVVLSQQSTYDISTRTASRKGLDALEYLLFNPSLEHSCTVFGTAPEGWNERTLEDRSLARCEFAKQVSTDLVDNADELLRAWSGEEGRPGYADVLKSAGQPDSEFSDVHQALNLVTDALFYIETLTKDAKLATPLGLFANDCGLAPCVENVESLYAQNSLDNIISNIQGLSMMFFGGDSESAVGFDDYLIEVGDGDTAQQMSIDLAEVEQFALSLQQSLTALLNQEPEQVREVHTQLKDLTDNLKNDFIQSLSLELPATSAGDND